MVYLFLANGFEEVEAITVVDILRRANIKTETVSIENKEVTGCHNITITADKTIDQIESTCDLIVLPGGMPGVTNLEKNKMLISYINKHVSNNKKVAAICAAPMLLANINLLINEEATIYPGMEDHLKGSAYVNSDIVISNNYITSKGPGTASKFGLKLVEILKNVDISNEIKTEMLYK